MMRSGDRAMLFVHVRKTGGTSLARALANRFAARECLLLYDRPPPSAKELRGKRFVSGHVDVSFASRFEPAPLLVTCLRDPIERALSVYSYYRWFPESDYHALLPSLGRAAYDRRVAAMQLARERSLDEFIGSAPELAREHLGNAQARALGGFPPLGERGESLERALAGIERFDFVALTERLDECAGRLARRLAWSEPGPLPRANMLSERIRREQLAPETMAALRRLTAIDAEVYGAAARRVESELAGGRSGGDPAASFPDAPIVPDLTFDAPIRGGAWSGRERLGENPWFCWTTHARRAWVDMRVPAGATTLVIEIAHLLERSALDELEVTVGEAVAPHELSGQNGSVKLSARLPAGLPEGESVRITIKTPRVARPSDLDPASSDTRELSIAVSRIALLAG